MATVDKLLIELALDNKKLVSSLQQSQVHIQRFSSNVKGLLTNVAEALAAVGVADFAKDLTTNFAQLGASLTLASKTMNVSIGSLEDWGQAAKRVGGTAAGLQGSMGNLYKKMYAAKYQGDMVTSGLFQILGVQAEDAHGHLRKVSDVMLDMSKAFKGMDSGKQQMIGAQLGLDPATIQLLAMGKVQLSSLLVEMSKHRVMTDAQAKKAMLLNAQIADMNQKWDQTKVALGERLMPVALQFMNNFIIPAINAIPKIIKGFDGFAHSIGFTGTHLGELIIGIMAFGKAISIIRMMAGAFAFLDASLLPLIAPLAVIAASLGGIAIAYKEIKGGKTGSLAENSLLNGSLPGAIVMGAATLAKKYSPQLTGGIKALSKKLGLDPLSEAQMMQESSGKNQIGYKYLTQNGHLVRDAQGRAQFAHDAQGNRIPEAYGLFQIKPSSASLAMGRNVTPQQLMDPKFNAQVHAKMMADAMKVSGGDIKGALAYYNGGMSDYNYYKRTGQTKNQYGEIISAEATKLQAQQIFAQNNKQTPTQQMVAQNNKQITVQNLLARNNMPKTSAQAANTVNNTSTSRNVHIAQMDVHGIQNHQDFINHMNEMGGGHDMAWTFSSARSV